MNQNQIRHRYTTFDPRDFVKTFRPGEFHMFELRTDLTPSQKSEMHWILIARPSVSGESWPVNAITEMESRGVLNGEQKGKAVENRKHSADMPYNRPPSQTNGA